MLFSKGKVERPVCRTRSSGDRFLSEQTHALLKGRREKSCSSGKLFDKKKVHAEKYYSKRDNEGEESLSDSDLEEEVQKLWHGGNNQRRNSFRSLRSQGVDYFDGYEPDGASGAGTLDSSQSSISPGHGSKSVIL